MPPALPIKFLLLVGESMSLQILIVLGCLALLLVGAMVGQIVVRCR